jgi:peptide/nickel transport system permease protein
MRRGIPRGLIPLAVVAVYVIVALAAPLIAPHDPNQTNLAARLLPPFSAASSSGGGARYLLGTDDLGRDVLSRVLYGARVSLAVAAVAVIASGAGGVALGLIAGWRRGWLGIVIMRIADIALSVPFFLIAILVVAVLGPSLVNVVICLAMVRWPRYTRITYATVLETRERGFVRGVVALGAPGRWIVLRHILPEVAPLAVVVGTLELGLMVIFEASLSFIGLGVQPPTASWGTMLSEGQQYVATSWWLATFPGVALFGLVLAVNMLGDAVRDRLDPTQRVRKQGGWIGRRLGGRALMPAGPGPAQDTGEQHA